MKKAALLFIIWFQSNHLIAQTNYSPETLAKIKEVENNVNGNIIFNDDRPGTIAERMAKYIVKGMSIAVIHDCKIAWAKGYGWADEAEKRVMTTEILFEPGSISKSLNAVGILKLAQDKKVDLYTDINTYLTSWKFPYDSLSNGKKINLAQILSHTAGLSTFGFPGQINSPIPTLLEVLDGKPPAVNPAVRSMFEPGLRFEYSGGGITISQLLLMDVTRRSYDGWMYENILQPLGMLNSSYAQPPAKDRKNLLASGYYSDGTPVSGKFGVYPEQAAAGLWTTPSELCKYIIDMQLAYQGKPSKVLNQEMVKLHLTPYNNGPAAMGTFFDDRDGARYFLHDASNDGFCGLFVGSLDDGNGVVIFLNSGEGKLMLEVLNSVAGAYHWKNYYRAPQTKRTVNVPDSISKTYEGIYLYDQTWGGVGKRKNVYQFYSNNIYAKMYYSTTTSFFNEEFQAVKEFIKDEKGNVTGYTRTVDGKAYPQATKNTKPDTLTLDKSMFAEIGWFLFETQKYDEAIAYYRRGLQLYPSDLNMLMNMAHTYLFSGDAKNALSIYKAHQKEAISPGISWEDQMRKDLIWFKERGYDVLPFDKVFEDLKIKK